MAQGPAVRGLTTAGRLLRRLGEAAERGKGPPGMLKAPEKSKKPTEKEVKKAKELREALESGRAEAKPGAKLLDLGPPLQTNISEMAIPNPRMVRRVEIQAANDAIKKSLRKSEKRRAEAKKKGRAYKRSRTPRPAHRTGGR